MNDNNQMTNVHGIYISTTIIECNEQKNPISSATGFFFKFKDMEKPYLVTNKHILYGNNWEEKLAKPWIDNINIILHTDSTNSRRSMEIPLKLVKKGKPIWLEHPNPTLFTYRYLYKLVYLFVL